MLQNILLGAGLAVDASAVSMTNGLAHPKMKVSKVIFIGFLFGLFQTIMPLIGYLIGSVFEDLIANLTPWIALILLGFNISFFNINILFLIKNHSFFFLLQQHQ